ncbi:hypothetical protein QYF36_013232 [Acer negundo]|nr:hypothetical protein QYF36_013232 [Acer negundo]
MGTQFQVVEQDTTNKSPLLLNSNAIYKKIPVLIHNQKPICESLVIIEYIDETWKNATPILPLDPYEKAVARFWAKFVEEKFTEVMRKVVFTKGEQQEKEVKEAKEAMEVLEGELKGKKFFGGDKIGLVDIVLGWISIWLEIMEETAGVRILDSEKCPWIHKWMHNFIDLSFVKENIPPRDRLVHYYQQIRQRVTSQ